MGNFEMMRYQWFTALCAVCCATRMCERQMKGEYRSLSKSEMDNTGSAASWRGAWQNLITASFDLIDLAN